MPYAVLEKQFDLLSLERQKSVFSYVNFLLAEQENEMKISSSSVSEKIALLDSLVGIVPSDIDVSQLKDERLSRSKSTISKSSEFSEAY